MAIMAIFAGKMTTAQYEALRKEVNWEGDQPMGGAFHAASFDDAGRIHVADVWESPETMNAFVARRLVSVFQKLGIAPPEVAVRPAYNFNAYRVIEKHRV
jgi:hypothetical protein